MFAEDFVIARGHPNITAKHRTTLEITKDKEIGPRADCIIGVSATKGCADLDDKLREIARSKGSRIELVIEVEGLMEVVRGYGDPKLSLSHPSDIVCRKSTYICPRTLMVRSDKSASDLDRDLVSLLRSRDTTIEITIRARL